MIPNPAKAAKLDLRMTPAQKEQLEDAAEASSMSLGAWALDRLLSCATRDIEEARTVAMSEEAYDELDRILVEEDEPEEIHAGLTEFE
jgi:uncharacterized protein (DUF1778 family)